MSDLERDILAYEAEQSALEAYSMGKWVVYYDAKRVCIVDTFEEAAARAVKDFGNGPYLIRQIGASGASIPASLLYQVG